MLAAGTAREPAGALTIAMAEALERHAVCTYSSRQFIMASAVTLGSKAVNLASLPACSEAELSHPMCRLRRPDPDRPIRWIRSVDLLTGRLVYIPAVLVFLNMQPMDAERFALANTTGCAAHVSYERAALNAALELVERDAISVTWLQQLELPEISLTDLPSDLRRHLEEVTSSTDIRCHFFDATTDIGIPTVYGLQVCRSEDRLNTLVSCSCALTGAEALGKVMKDMVAIRYALRHAVASATDPDQMAAITDGALYMAGRERAHAFDFLLHTRSSIRLDQMASVAAKGAQALAYVLSRLRNAGCDVLAVDITTDEARRSGVVAVRLVIPQLQPLSFNYRARFLAHRRLYSVPRSMGLRVRQENQLNPWPQPFA